MINKFSSVKSYKIIYRLFFLIIVLISLALYSSIQQKTHAVGLSANASSANYGNSPNLIPNPSVEVASASNAKIPQSWTTGNRGTNTAKFTYNSYGEDGTRSVRIDITSYTNGDAKWYFTPIVVSPNTSYTFSDFYRSNVTTSIVVQTADAQGNLSYRSLGSENPGSGTTWVKATFSFTTSASAKSVTILHLISSVGYLETDTFSLTQQVTTMAWIYPGDPACNAPNEFSDGRQIVILKPQYFNLLSTGALEELTVDNVGCNGYSPANVALLKQYSQKQFVTVSGVTAGVMALTDDNTKMTAAITTLTTFVTTNGLTGIELDFEAVYAWSGTTYQNYLGFVTKLGNALHAQNEQLMIAGPAIASSGYPNWKYEDFKNLPVDYLVVMAYDHQYGPGVGSSVSPLYWINQVCAWMKATIGDPNRIVIGLPSYGYHGLVGQSGPITNDTYTQTQQIAGYQQATRDSGSGELFFTSGGTFYDYADSQTLNIKRQIVINAGLENISVWHLGGNQWFSN